MDYMLKASINRLRITSLYLFIFTNIALFGTLFFHNIFTQANYGYPHYGQSSQANKNVVCNKDNNFCYSDRSWNKISETIKRTLSPCDVKAKEAAYNVDDLVLSKTNYVLKVFDENKKIKPKYKNSNIFISFKKTNGKNINCIKNYPLSYSIYKVFPKIPTLIVDIKRNPNYFDATKKVVNPFFYGETSISNIAKRYPLKIIFKPFLFIASLLMIFYWTYTKKVICLFDKSKKIQLYYYFGILSGIFLFLHVFFLGSEIENEIFKNLRKYIIAFFILFELFAQFLLIIKIFFVKKLINNYINYFILKLKWFFVLFFLILTVLILSLQIFLDFPKEVDYIIEWNYFVFLSFYYLLTFFLWKKN